MIIKRKDLSSRADRAASDAPDIEDRLRIASSLAHSHPVMAATTQAQPPNVANVIPHDEVTRAGRFEVVPVSQIDTNPYNARKIYRPERVNELAASIGAHGQDTPGLATIRNGRYVLAAGHYRLKAINVLGLPTMNLMVHDDLTDKELYGYSYRENAEREGQTALDNAYSWRHLLDQNVYGSETELAEATGVSLPNLNKTLKALSLSAGVLDVVSERPDAFGVSHLYELELFERVAGETEAIAMAQRIMAGEVTRTDIQEARARLAAPKSRKSKETSRPYRFSRDGAYSGALKVFGDSGRVSLDVVFTDPGKREEALSLLKTHFNISE